MKWFISGGCGFIGRALVNALLKIGNVQIRVYDNMSVGKVSDLSSRKPLYEVDPRSLSANWFDEINVINGDILDAKKLELAMSGADVVVHLAANTGVPQSVDNPLFDCQVNVLGTLNMLMAARATEVQKFIFASSGAPLGVQIPPLNESLLPKPISPYGASKLSAEAYLSAFNKCYDLDTIALRFANVYGEGSEKKNSVVSKFIRLALEGKPITINGTGGQTRDFIHVDDLVNSIKSSCEVSNIGGEIFQIATSTETSINELIQELSTSLSVFDVNFPEIIFTDERNGDVLRNYSDISKANKLLNWYPQINLSEGLERTVRYFLSRKLL